MKLQVVDRELAASSLGYTYEIGNMVAEAFSKVGRKGAVVTLKGGKHAAKDDSLYLVEGMQFDCDYFLPYFVTNSEEMSFDVENCKVRSDIMLCYFYYNESCVSSFGL